MDDKVIISVLIAIITLAIGYSKYLDTQKDISEIALADQTDVSATRKPGETGYYRNRLVSHGFPLLHGLSIKHGYKLRDGNVRDIWKLAVQANTGESRKIKFYTNNGKARFSADYLTLNGLFKHIYSRLMELSNYSDFNKTNGDLLPNLNIGVVLPTYSWQNFVISMTCFVNNFTLHTFHTYLPKYTMEGLDVLVICKKDLVPAIKFNRSNVKLFVVLEDEDVHGKKSHAEKETLDLQQARYYANVISWEEFLQIPNGEDQLKHIERLANKKYDYAYDPKYDDFIPLKETVNYNTTTYTNQNLVSSVAAELKNVPLGQEWDAEKDELAVMAEMSALSIWNKLLTAIMLGMEISIVEPLKLHEIKTIDFEDMEQQMQRENRFVAKKFLKFWLDFSAKASHQIIAVIPAYYLKSFAELEEENFVRNSLISKFLIGRSQMLLQQGVFNKMGEKSAYFRPIRTIYSVATTSNNRNLNTWKLSLLRSLTGARIVSERYLPGIIAPLFSTNLYDYRIIQDGTDNSMNNVTFRGVPSPTVEVKLVDYKLLNEEHLADDDAGELCIRGFIIGKVIDEEVAEQKRKEAERVGGQGWMTTGIIGRWGDDGCFYEKVYEW